MERSPGLPFLPDFKLWKSKIFQKKKHQTADSIPQQSWILEGSETSINIYGKVDYIIIHRSDEDTQTQVRGRYRETLQTLYVLKYDGPIRVPSEYLDRDLYTEDKNKLCALLNIHNNKGRRVGWTTIKKKLKEAGYTLTERHPGSRRCTVISL